MKGRMNQTLAELDSNFTEYRLSDALMSVRKLVWDDFCSWYLEMIKPDYGQPIAKDVLEETTQIFGQLMTMLHPFMPFVTEEIWHNLKERSAGEDCVISTYPKAAAFDQAFIKEVNAAMDLISNIRDVRNKNGLKQKELLKVFAQAGEGENPVLKKDGLKAMVLKMAYLESLELTTEDIENGVSFLSGTDKYFVELQIEVNVEEECERIKKELDYAKGFVTSVNKKLSNERFVQNAPEAVVNKERQKLADGEAKIKSLEESLAKLGCS
jgi:valyl-tRNA synthetase